MELFHRLQNAEYLNIPSSVYVKTTSEIDVVIDTYGQYSVVQTSSHCTCRCSPFPLHNMYLHSCKG